MFILQVEGRASRERNRERGGGADRLYPVHPVRYAVRRREILYKSHERRARGRGALLSVLQVDVSVPGKEVSGARVHARLQVERRGQRR